MNKFCSKLLHIVLTSRESLLKFSFQTLKNDLKFTLLHRLKAKLTNLIFSSFFRCFQYMVFLLFTFEIFERYIFDTHDF